MLIDVIEGETPTEGKLQAIANQCHITATTSQRLGLSSPPAGLHCYDTSLHRDFVWDGSNWIPIGGSDRVRGAFTIDSGNRQTIPNAALTDLTWINQEENTDGWIPAGLPGHVLHAPFDGVYSVQCSVYFTGQVGSLGGKIKFVRGGSFNDYVMRNIPPQGSEDTLPVVAYTMLANDTFKFQVLQTTGGDLDCSARVQVTWESP